MILIIILVGCKNSKNHLTIDDVDNIYLEVLSEQVLDQVKVYTIELINQTDRVLVQNEVYLSYPITSKSQTRQNDLVVRAKNNKLNIKPKEKVTLFIHIPGYILDAELVDFDNPCVEIIGYFDEVTEDNRFQRVESLPSYFQK